MPVETVHFEDFELDRSAYQLRRGGSIVHLERIPFDLLNLLVERHGELVTRQEILEQIWGKDVYVDADNSINTAVRKIRRALDDNPEEPRFVVTIPARGYRFVAAVREATQEDSKQSLSGEATRAMLVVLPFENITNDPTQEYFSDGLTEETITNLGELGAEGLGVIARTSAMSYKGTRKSIAEIGRELGVGYALEGSVRRDGNRLRISAQLIRTSDQTHLWAHNYDCELKDVLTVQSELGRAISDQVQVKLTPEEGARTVGEPMINQGAYDAFLQGRFFLWRVTRPNIERAIEHFRRAIQLDARMAVAYAGIADAYDVLPITSDTPPGDSFRKSEQAAIEALKIDQGLAEAHSTLSSVRFWYNWNWAASEEHSRRAIARNTNYSLAHLRYGHLLSNIGRHEEAIAQIELARQLDPFSLITNTLCAQFRFQARRFEEVEPLLERALELEPHFWVAHILAVKFYQHQKRFEEALAAARRAREFSGGNTEAVALAGYTYGLMGRREDAERVIEELKQLGERQYVPPYNVATIYLGLGEEVTTLEWLEKAYEGRDVHLVFLKVEPKWDVLRGNSRFRGLMRRIGLRE
ncbi:MAG: winged helix-turn-helix domain-containing protein [Candidatus Acidiferrales bacterium]